MALQLDSSRDGIVAAEVQENELVLYFHDGDRFKKETLPHQNVLVLSEAPEVGISTELQGPGVLRYLTKFASEKELETCRKTVAKTKAPMLNFRDQLIPALIFNRLRLFGGMEFAELRRLQFAVTGDDSALQKIEVRCKGTTQELSGTESEMCEAFRHLVAEYDPDVIEGYNCCRYDWPTLAAAFKRTKVFPALGRGGAQLKHRASRLTIGERQVNYTKFEVAGRHLLDLWQQVQLYDVARRDLPGYEPDELREYFKFPAGSATELVERLSDTLTPSFFYYTQFLPMRFQEAVIRGNGSRIDTLLTGLYLAENRALPLPELAQSFMGAISGAERSGVFHPVWHCDVRSLYPSILIAGQRAPVRDEAGVFLEVLGQLRQFRLHAKDAARQATNPAEKQHWTALQTTFKIMINSFYGYLGFSQGSFNDYALAAAVTATGREILTHLAEFLTSSGAEVIEMDTDGIYFRPPETVTDPEAFQKAIQATLPNGIEIELDAVFPAMFSYKAKNYALLRADGEVALTGAALKSRGMEPFLRHFLRHSITLLLQGKAAEIPAFYQELQRQITERALPLCELARTETLNDSPANYQKKLAAGTGRRSAAYELVLKSAHEYRAGDRVNFYITGVKPKVAVVDNSCLLEDGQKKERDENIAFYTKKLEDLYQTFAPFFSKF